jgi:hypothetical protein
MLQNRTPPQSWTTFSGGTPPQSWTTFSGGTPIQKILPSTAFLQTKEDKEYFNKTFEDVVKILQKLGFVVKKYVITQESSESTILDLNCIFWKMPDDANNFLNLVKRIILREEMNENPDKNTK